VLRSRFVRAQKARGVGLPEQREDGVPLAQLRAGDRFPLIKAEDCRERPPLPATRARRPSPPACRISTLPHSIPRSWSQLSVRPSCLSVRLCDFAPVVLRRRFSLSGWVVRGFKHAFLTAIPSKKRLQETERISAKRATTSRPFGATLRAKEQDQGSTPKLETEAFFELKVFALKACRGFHKVAPDIDAQSMRHLSGNGNS